jgi:hypothetical protein
MDPTKRAIVDVLVANAHLLNGPDGPEQAAEDITERIMTVTALAKEGPRPAPAEGEANEAQAPNPVPPPSGTPPVTPKTS